MYLPLLLILLIQLTSDTLPDVTYTNDVLSNGSRVSTSAATLYNYVGTFSHVIYSSTGTNVSSGQTLIVNGHQQATNSSYPNNYVQYTFVDPGSSSSPDDDILLTGVTNSTAGSYTVAGDYNLSFYINSSAGTGRTAFLRAVNQYDTSHTTHIWGQVSR